MREPRKSGSSSGAGYRRCSRVIMLLKDHQAMQLPRPFSGKMHDVAAHVFPEKARQAQKRYMRRSLLFGRRITMKEWVAQPLDDNVLLDILEYRVSASWHREFTVQLCEPSADKHKGEKPPKSENAGKCKTEDTTHTKAAGPTALRTALN
eukprot:4315825-Ditylum_brightwellii.AAC.1